AVLQRKDFQTSIALACLSIFHRIASRNVALGLLHLPEGNRGHRSRLQQVQWSKNRDHRCRLQLRRRASLCKFSSRRRNNIDRNELLQGQMKAMIAVTFALPAESSAFLRRLSSKFRS